MKDTLPTTRKIIIALFFIFLITAITIWFKGIVLPELDLHIKRKLSQSGALLVYSSALLSILSPELSAKFSAKRISINEKKKELEDRKNFLAALEEDLPSKFKITINQIDSEIQEKTDLIKSLEREPNVKSIAVYGSMMLLVIGTLCQLVGLG